VLELTEPEFHIGGADLSALSRAFLIISCVISTPITRPVGPT
jgi:hypothetical protein